MHGFCNKCGAKVENNVVQTATNNQNVQTNANVISSNDEVNYIIAIVSVISIIVGIFIFGIVCGLIGIICGTIVRERTSKSGNQTSSKVRNMAIARISRRNI